MLRTSSLLAAVALAAVCQTGFGAAIVAYNDGFAAATSTLAGASATAINPSPLVNGQVTTTLGKVSNAYYVSQPFFTATRGTSTEATIAANVYFSFTVTADAGKELDLSSFTFNVNRGGAGTPRTYDVKTSVDGYATSLTGGPQNIDTARPTSSAATGTTWTNASVNLNGAAFQNLSVITVRVYYFTPGGNQAIDVDNVQLNGTVSAVPEPAAIGLVGAGMALLAGRRRAPRASRA